MGPQAHLRLFILVEEMYKNSRAIRKRVVYLFLAYLLLITTYSYYFIQVYFVPNVIRLLKPRRISVNEGKGPAYTKGPTNVRIKEFTPDVSQGGHAFSQRRSDHLSMAQAKIEHCGLSSRPLDANCSGMTRV
jgi:hypothetical protein